jgi:histidine triad (HIT) family protein
MFHMTTTPQQTEGKPCVFCTIPDIQNREITGNDLAWAFPTNIPITLGHTLIAPRACKARLEELNTEERIAVLSLADEIMEALRKAYGAEGFNCIWNQEKLAGQSVPHFHLHIIPRKEGDTGLLGYDPRSMLYRTGDREPSPETELLATRDSIRAHLDAR